MTTRPAAAWAAGHPLKGTHDARPGVPQARVGGVELHLLVIAGFPVGAAAIHAAVIPEHLNEYWPFAAFFAATALFQSGWALAVARRPSRRMYLVGGAASAALVAPWVLSRTTGLPMGPEPWRPERAARLDALAAGLELGIIAAATAKAPRPRRAAPIDT